MAAEIAAAADTASAQVQDKHCWTLEHLNQDKIPVQGTYALSSSAPSRQFRYEKKVECIRSDMNNHARTTGKRIPVSTECVHMCDIKAQEQ